MMAGCSFHLLSGLDTESVNLGGQLSIANSMLKMQPDIIGVCHWRTEILAGILEVEVPGYAS